MLVASTIAQNFIQSSCHLSPSKLLNGLRVSLALIWTILGANHQLISKPLREQMFSEQDNLHPCHSCSRISQIVNLYNIGQPVVNKLALVLLEVSLMNLILEISREIRWNVEALMNNIFIILHIL